MYSFEEEMKDVPEYIKNIVVLVCKRFCIKGTCDGMYIANVIANQNNMGDGVGHFNGEEH